MKFVVTNGYRPTNPCGFGGLKIVFSWSQCCQLVREKIALTSIFSFRFKVMSPESALSSNGDSGRIVKSRPRSPSPSLPRDGDWVALVSEVHDWADLTKILLRNSNFVINFPR
jgi:hypothetical protein